MKLQEHFRLLWPAALGIAALLWLGGAAATAQITAAMTQPATDQTATTEPTTTRARYVATIPPGFVRISGQGAFWSRTIFCPKDDASWLADALTPAGPATRPTTMPADLLQQLQAKRQKLIDRISDDLAITPAQATNELDQHLLPYVQIMQSMQPSVIFLVTTVVDLRKILHQGWENPQFRFNPDANESVYLGAHVDLAVGRAGDDSVFPVIYRPNEKHEVVTTQLNEHIREDEAVLATDVSVRAQSSLQMQFSNLLDRELVSGLKAKDDQQWFYVGLLGVLPTKWMALLTGGDENQMLIGLERPNPANPLRAAGLDLIHPVAFSSLQPSAIPLYEDAYRRRSTFIVDYWLEHAPPGSLHKTMVGLRANPPADCAALVNIIKSATGANLMPLLVPQE
jgi:hypothetical protein